MMQTPSSPSSQSTTPPPPTKLIYCRICKSISTLIVFFEEEDIMACVEDMACDKCFFNEIFEELFGVSVPDINNTENKNMFCHQW